MSWQSETKELMVRGPDLELGTISHQVGTRKLGARDHKLDRAAPQLDSGLRNTKRSSGGSHIHVAS